VSASLLPGLALVTVNLLAWDQSSPDGGWSRWSPRPQLAPAFAVEREGLRVSGQGRPQVLGGWRRAISGIVPGTAYHFSTEVAARGIESVRRGIVCQVRWTGSDLGNEVTPEYVNDVREAGSGLVELSQAFTAPAAATGAEVSLLVQWAPDAELVFRRVSFEAVGREEPRPVRVATIYWRPGAPSTPEKNVAAFAALVDRAAAQGPDLVLLPEAITSIGTGLDVVGAAQEKDGPAFRVLSERARQHHAYVAYGAYERQGESVFNSVFIVGRDGALAGLYRKVQLPVGEVESGLSPGDAFPTFDLDFGRVGVLICHDAAFGEPARVLALGGAEILLVPGWGGDLTQLRARALDNGTWLVTSGYDVPSAFIDPTGEVLASTWKDPDGGIAAMSIDLAKRVRRPWVGDWRNAVMKQRRTDAYRGLLER
jgi:predicted amidohydrolase